MKPILGLVSGFMVSLGMFAGGVAVAIFMVVSEPPRVAEARGDLLDLWSVEPRTVNPAAQPFERLPAVPVALESDSAPDQDAVPVASTGTGDVKAASTPGTAESAHTAAIVDSKTEQLVSAHVEWCANRFRSYRPEDNSYIGYSGEQRPCLSPYLDELAEAAGTLAANGAGADAEIASGDAENEDAQLLFASDDGAQIGEHEIDCMNRYRSYRPEDNTYQPYGGGPRRQCR